MGTHKQSRLNKMLQDVFDVRMIINGPEQLELLEDEIRQIQKEKDEEYERKLQNSTRLTQDGETHNDGR
jgi:sRNA-binding carbon storage regulator CsrA